MTREPQIDTSPMVSDEVRKTTCYMCACRCGIDVHLKDGEVATDQQIWYLPQLLEGMEGQSVPE